MNILPEVSKIYCETKTGQKVIIILPRPIPFASYYAYKFGLKTSGKYKSVKFIKN